MADRWKDKGNYKKWMTGRGGGFAKHFLINLLPHSKYQQGEIYWILISLETDSYPHL